jgi:hypothetical protein
MSDIRLTFSDDALSNSAQDPTGLVVIGKKVLKTGDNMEVLMKNLVKSLHILSDNPHQTSCELDPNDELQKVLLENWVEEILRFLALKTLTEDYSEPCQLAPGYAVGVGWKALILLPNMYKQICTSMGNPSVFDHDPSDTSTRNKTKASQLVKEKHLIKRYNATLRVYNSYFDKQPPALYWSFYARKKRDLNIFDSLGTVLCGIDSSTFLGATTPFNDMLLSPNMPSSETATMYTAGSRTNGSASATLETNATTSVYI